ncbi:hypothetical protein Ahy_A03g012495 [Arachis hypogaea]|uniref:Uncharacterized protein n=1 Tax=Arachis hypogaea TaxID=3818 RepID=A0A445DTJ1_ARAHY|nr:hypothetical protein Ahy_A03g012495 [Arachis hypogaea]
MRLLMSSSNQHGGGMKRFANWILDIGNGNIGSIVDDELEIEIPNDLLITTVDDPLFNLEDFAYPDLLQNISDYRYFQSRITLTSTLESIGARNCELYFFTTLIIPGNGSKNLVAQYHGITQLRTTNQQVHWVVQVINLT